MSPGRKKDRSTLNVTDRGFVQSRSPSKLFLKGPPLSKCFFMGSRWICEICPTDLGNVLSGMSDYISMAFFQVDLVMLNHQWAETKLASGPVEQQKDNLLGKLTMNA